MQTTVVDNVTFIALVIEIFLLSLLVSTVKNGKFRETILLGSGSLFVFFVYMMFIAAIVFGGK
jgi:hypothetical protein